MHPPRARRNPDYRERAIKTRKTFYKKSEPIFDKFRLSPVLHITDVDMLFLSDKSCWRPRRFSPVWTLYSTIIHSSFRYAAPLSPAYGLYTDIGLVVDRILQTGSLVSYIHPPKAPFQCVRLDQFTLRNRISEDRILSESFHYPIHDDVSIQPLKLRDVEAFFDNKKSVSPSGIDQHTILRRALKSAWKLVCISSTIKEDACSSHVLNFLHLLHHITAGITVLP